MCSAAELPIFSIFFIVLVPATSNTYFKIPGPVCLQETCEDDYLDLPMTDDKNWGKILLSKKTVIGG